MRARAGLLALAALGLWSAGWGCSGLPDKIGFAGQSVTLQSGTQVAFQDAWVADDIFKVKLYIQNVSQAFMMIDRDGFALRLPDGRVLPRAQGVFTQHVPYQVPPAAGHDVWVDFRDPGHDMRLIQSATLVIGGISFSTDPRPRVVGELPLVPTGPR